MAANFHASNGIILVHGGALHRESVTRLASDSDGAALVAAARAEALAQGYPVDAASLKMEEFARNFELSKAGVRDIYDAAIAADDSATAMRLAAQVGYPLARMPAKQVDDETPAAFSFARVGDVMAAGLKPVGWLVRNYVESDSLALMFGDPGCGKSFAAIDLSCCVATGTAWHGNRTTPGAVFYIAGEGQNGLMKRFAAWSQHNRIPLAGAPLFVSSKPAQLTVDSSAACVYAAVAELEATSGQRPALIVVDTLARNFGGADENSSQDMNAFVANVDAFLRKNWDATVLLVHHSGHADKSRARGSSVLKGALDAEYSLTKDDAGTVRIEATKMKDAEQPAPVAFTMESVTLDGVFDEDGEPVTSVALSCVSYVPPARPGKAGRGKNQVQALQILRELGVEHRKRVSDSGRDPSAARVSMEAWRDRMGNSGLNRFQIRDVVGSLKDSGTVVTDLGGYVYIAGEV